VEEEFRITEPTANSYIKIHESFDIHEISDLIVSNLKVIAEIQLDKLRGEVVKAFASQKSEDFAVKEVIATVALLDRENKKYKQGEIESFVKEIIQRAKAELILENRKRKNLVKFGEVLNAKAFPEIEKRFEKNPINEMGVVALFCVAFDYMREASFKLENDTLCFKNIKYVQAAFPDACILCGVADKKSTNTELHIEFEYKSFEYITHKHYKSPKKCHLIICWEDNAKRNSSKSPNVKELPPIIELKDFLETGKINLK
jgi:hypothetical protein